MLSSISLFLLLALRVAGDSITPTNAPLPSENGQLFMEFPSMKFEVAPLTPGAGMGQQGNVFSTINLSGDLVVPTDSGNSTQKNQIAFLSCDINNGSNLDGNQTFTTAASHLPKAIVLYSTTDNACDLDETSNYTSVFTMKTLQSSLSVLSLVNKGSTLVTIVSNESASSSGTPTSSSSSSSSAPNPPENPGTPAPTTAVAMSILYSITGIITLLFLIIIATGAIRAHRHPERYGPRNGFPGRPRQSRAKGLARAMLETLPIVKFGDPEPDKTGRDVELESANSNVANPEAIVAAGGREGGETHNTDPAIEQEGGLGPNQNPPATGGEVSGGEDENLGCSICTEDFTRGEDVRVLPCNHKYHPACIDPWLLNVSGTCPLCRVDLRPVETNTSELPRAEDLEGSTGVAEGSEADGIEPSTAGPSATRRRMSRFLDFNRLRHAEPEERIAALRRFRTQEPVEGETTTAEEGVEANTASNESTVGSTERERNRRSRFTRTIRAAFDIRTVRSGSNNPVPAAASDAAMVGGRGA